MRVKRSFLGLSVLLLLTLVLLACGGGGEEAPTATPEPAASAGDAENGRQLYLNEGGCGACHTIEGVEGATGQVGPDHTHMATKAEELAQELGLSGPREYLRQSIVEPNAHVSEDCPTGPCTPGTMPANFDDQFSEEQINDIVAFLMQQQ